MSTEATQPNATPSRDDLIQVMREVRDSAAHPHDQFCPGIVGAVGCSCSRARRHIGAWAAFHAALEAAGVPRLK